MYLIHKLAVPSLFVFRFWLSVQIPTSAGEFYRLPPSVQLWMPPWQTFLVRKVRRYPPRHSAINLSGPKAVHLFRVGGFHRGIGPLNWCAIGILIYPCTVNAFPTMQPITPDIHLANIWLVQSKHKHNTPAPLCNITQCFKCGRDVSGALDCFLSVPDVTWENTYGMY